MVIPMASSHGVIPCYEKVSVDALYVFDIVDGWSDLACFRQGLRQKHDGCAAETSPKLAST